VVNGQMKGYDLQEGEYERRYMSEDELWNTVNWLFSSHSKNDSSYKFILFKSIIDCTDNMNDDNRISFDKLFERFTEISWNIVLKYRIRQKAITKSKNETYLEQVLHRYSYDYLNGQFIAIDEIPKADLIKICNNVKIKCKRYVIGALYCDMNRVFYSFSKKREWIKVNPTVCEFIKANRAVIESLNYFKWAKFYESINDIMLIKRLENLIDNSFTRKNESVFRTILANEFERADSYRENEKTLNSLEVLFVAEECQKNINLDIPILSEEVENELFEDFEIMRTYLSEPVLLINQFKKERGILI